MSKRVALAVTVAAAVAAACGETFISISSDGRIEVAIHTTGAELGFDGFSVSVDGGAERLVPSGSPVTLTGLTEGTHSVRLSGLGGDCRVEGSNPRSVVVEPDGVAAVVFDVRCEPAPAQRSRSRNLSRS